MKKTKKTIKWKKELGDQFPFIELDNKDECHHEFGWKTLGGFPGHEHTHPIGNQICLKCGKTFIDIISHEKQNLIKKIGENILPKVQKFIDKVETGRAKSKETYSDMIEIKSFLETLEKII